MKLAVLPIDDYVRDVLPVTAEMWSRGRDLATYADDLRRFAESGYGRRRFRTIGLFIDGQLVASLKRYQRELRCGSRTLTAAGIGAVFTPKSLRGRGYASALIGAFLDAERAAGTDVAFLFSDIHPAFYQKLGFLTLPSRTMSLRADTLPAQRIALEAFDVENLSAIRRCFDAHEERRPCAFLRPPLVWSWFGSMWESQVNRGGIRLAAYRGRRIAAYIVGRRVPTTDAFIVDEVAHTTLDDAALVGPLLRNAAGDLRKITGWLPPPSVRDALPRGAIRRRKDGIAMLVPISSAARSAYLEAAPLVQRSTGDTYWSADHV